MAFVFGPPFSDDIVLSGADNVFVGGDGPYKRGKCARDGDFDWLSSPGKTRMPGALPHLRLLGDVLDRVRQGFVAFEDLGPDTERAGDSSRRPRPACVLLSCFQPW
jgi:hypothetical protein